MKMLRPALVLCLATVMPSPGNVVAKSNTIAATTIVKNGGKPPCSSAIRFAYSSLAVYDAVIAITGQFRPF